MLEAKIPLGHVAGRIDHLAIDLQHRRLFVSELGNNSVGVVDVDKRTTLHTIMGLSEPQGLAYLPRQDALYVANAGDGLVRLFRGSDYSAIGRIDLGEDADNIRVDGKSGHVLVGYGSGALAIIDPANRKKVGEAPLRAHPESFQLDGATSRAFVNLPEARSIAVVDLGSLRQVESWPTKGSAANFPMALIEGQRRVLVAFRRPATLGVFSMSDGAPVASTPICGDADDVFFDPKRKRAYISCGDGFIDVIDTRVSAFPRIAHIPTAPGARTSLFDPVLDRLFLAVRATASHQAAIWVFRPAP